MSETPTAAYRRIKSAVNSPKHALMDVVQRLRSAGALGRADSLENIIRRLEEWQNR